MENAIAAELERYLATLLDSGFNVGAANAYKRKLGEFLVASPELLDAGEGEAAEAIESYIGAAPAAPDDRVLRASLRKWHWTRFGKKLGKTYVRVADFPTSPQVEDEVARFRARLESDGMTPACIDARCSTAAIFLGWRFPDGDVDVSAVGSGDALGYLATVKAHLSPGSAKLEASKLKRYLRFIDERIPGRRRAGLPLAPACWGTGSLPRMIGDDELAAIMSAETNPEVGSRNRAALLLMANMGLRCGETVALTLDDLDFRNGAVSVPAVKACHERKLPLEAAAGEAVAEYVARYRPESGSRAVFLRNKSHRGEPMSVSQMRGSLRYQAKLAGVGDFGTHMLRRRAATSMVERGVPMKVVADVLGHSEIQTTGSYLRIDVEGLRAVAADWPGEGRG